ncbi:unnamed protein product, partial [Prorocentrum cordatum]
MEWQFVAADEAKEFRAASLRRQLAAADPEHAQMAKEREQAAKERDLRAQGQALAAALQSSSAEHLKGLQTVKSSDSKEVLIKAVLKSIKKKNIVGSVNKVFKSASVKVPDEPQSKADMFLSTIK